MREDAGEILLCGNVREKRAKCGSLPPNAGGLATMLWPMSLVITLTDVTDLNLLYHTHTVP